jgi:hypothetical protein
VSLKSVLLLKEEKMNGFQTFLSVKIASWWLPRILEHIVWIVGAEYLI